MRTRTNRWVGLWALIAMVALQPSWAAESPAAAAHHSLWKLEGKTNAVYLLGSIHLLKPENYPLAAPIESAFSNAQIVVFETDIEKMESPEAQFKLLSKSQLPEGETLKDRLSPALYSNFVKHAEDSGVPMMMLERFTPSMAAVTLEVMELMKLDLDPEYGLDKHFFDRARKSGKEIIPLETVDFQIGLITEFSKEESELLMKSTLEEIDNTRKLYGDMLKAWQNGDAPAMEKLLNEAMQEAPVIFRRLVTDRNRRWVPKIEELLRGGKNVIVIVGAGHLVGAEGVVELLKKEGLKVSQQ